MSEITNQELRAKIIDILKTGTCDLYSVTPKSIRKQLETELGVSLLSKKKEIKDIATEEIQKISKEEEEKEESEGSESGSSSDEEIEKPKLTRACAPARKAPVKRKKKATNGDNSGSDDGDEDYKSTKKAKKSRKGTGFTRPYTLSPQLSALMGADSLPRHEVVKKVWAIIKERNLYDPKNKQYAICDAELLEVMKIKRFRTFGMLKYLKPHFLD